MVKVYRSKLSYSLIIIIFLLLYIPLTLSLIGTGFDRFAIGSLSFITLLFTSILYFMFNTVYIVDHKTLRIKLGQITYKTIDIIKIKSITQTNSWISAPASSFDRIELKYGKFEEVIISPKDKKEFIEALLKINPEIIVQLKN